MPSPAEKYWTISRIVSLVLALNIFCCPLTFWILCISLKLDCMCRLLFKNNEILFVFMRDDRLNCNQVGSQGSRRARQLALIIYVCKSTVLVIIKLTKCSVPVRFRFGCGYLTFCLYFIIVAIFNNVVHILEPGETPSYSASYQAPNYVQHSWISQNNLKRFVAVAVDFFSIYLNSELCKYVTCISAAYLLFYFAVFKCISQKTFTQ